MTAASSKRWLAPVTILLLSVAFLVLTSTRSPSQEELEPRTVITTTVTLALTSPTKAPNLKTKPQYTPGKADPHKRYQKSLIVSSIKKENTSWVFDLLPDVDKYVYVNDDPAAILTVPKNKFNEVMAYLTFIIDHYDRLPEIMIFIHAHASTHHNPPLMHDTADLINRLNPQRVMREGYMNLNCGNWASGRCTAQMRPVEGEPFGTHIEAWRGLFPEYPLPQILAQFCCGQFAVSRDRIQQIPLNDFKRWREWLLNTKLSGMGFFFEYLWQFIFKGEHVYCPPSWHCFCDGFGLCFGGERNFSAYNRLQQAKERLIEEVDTINSNERQGRAGSEDAEYIIEPSDGRRRENMRKVIADIDLEIRGMRATALERGKDPKLRAEELGRTWKEGDGFL